VERRRIIAGPISLEILEAASGDNLHDLGFLDHRMSKIAGCDVRIIRIGMAGTLGYEVHGNIENAHDVYNAIWEAGQPLGMRKLGQQAYMMNHTEDGFPQAYYHFLYTWDKEDVVDIYRSQFEEGDHYHLIETPNDFFGTTFHFDKVLNDKGEVVGCSSGRSNSYHFRKMISLCTIDREYAKIGTELTLVWGNEGERQKSIKVKVARFPYLNENRNEHIDSSTPPQYLCAKSKPDSSPPIRQKPAA
jgi:glycine cleavage system aminomethyltransferase T